MQTTVLNHSKEMPDHRSVKRNMFSPLVSSTVKMESSSRTRVHSKDLDAKLQDAKGAAHKASKKEETDKTNYGTTIARSSISSACSPNTCHYNEDKLLRYELEGLPNRGIPFISFIDAIFPNRQALDEILMADALVQVEERRSLFVNVATTGISEEAMYAPFVTLVNSIIGLVEASEIAYIDTHRHSPSGAVKHANRRPDGVFVHKREDGMLPRVRRSNSSISPEDLRWNEVLVSVDLKRDKTTLMTDSKFMSAPARMTYEELQKRLEELQVQIKLNPREQVASYALEALSGNALKSATLGMVVVNDMIEMWYFDRAGCLGSDVLELRKEDDFYIFVNAIMAVASASPTDLGLDPCFAYEGRWPFSQCGCTISIPSVHPEGAPIKAKILSDDPIDVSRGLSGRGTRVLPVGIWDDLTTYVLKLSWQPVSRVSEAEWYRQAGDLEGIPEVLCDGDLSLLSDGTRGRLEALMENRDNLPGGRVLRAIITSCRFMRVQTVKKTNGAISRGVTALLSRPGDVLRVMRSILDVHNSLYLRGILHRDLNPGNVMWIKKPKGLIQGILIDLDFASGVEDDPNFAPDAIPFTFSTPFLALDLLEQEYAQPYVYRHDLESFIWTFLWLILGHARVQTKTFSVTRWQLGSKHMIAESKRKFLDPLIHDEVFEILLQTRSNVKLVESLRRLTSLLAAGDRALKTNESNWVTAGGYITYDNLALALG